MSELKCDICDKAGFKSKAGLAGHKKIAHGEDRRKTVPDEIGKRLEGVERDLSKLATAWMNNSKVLQSNDSHILELISTFADSTGKNFRAVQGWIERTTEHLVSK